MVTDELLEKADVFARDRISEKRYAHTLRVAETAERLAKIHGQDSTKARLAALLHDAAREEPEPLSLARRWGIPAGSFELDRPILLHGPLAAELARRELGIVDEEVLEAIRDHTTGEPGMSPTALVLYVADKIEPGRGYPDVERFREMAEEDLYGTTRELLAAIRAKNEDRGQSTHPASLDTLRWLQEAADGGMD
jgi:predicted HD superfamily hydrolase involved in NAD metabolism